MGGGRGKRARTDPAQFADFAVSLAAVPGRRHSRHAVLAAYGASVLLCRGVRVHLRLAVYQHRQVQGSTLDGVPARSREEVVLTFRAPTFPPGDAGACAYFSRNASKSAFTSSARVVHMPC